MHEGLEVIPLPWVFRIEEFEHLDNECFIQAFANVLRINLMGHDKLQKQFVDYLIMRPCFFKVGFIFVGIEGWCLGHWGTSTQGSEYVLANSFH